MESLDPARDGAAARLLAASCDGSIDKAQTLLASTRADGATVFARVIAGEIVAVAVVRIEGLTAELEAVAVDPGHRGQGHGEACLEHALRLVGHRPLAVETDEATLGFYRAGGFKLIGKRRRPDGTIHYRLAAHARLPQAAALTLRWSPPGGKRSDGPA